MTNKYMEKCPSLAIRQVEIKTTLRFYFIPVRIAIIKKARNNKCWCGCRDKGPQLAGI
jgi:hypothetical protein